MKIINSNGFGFLGASLRIYKNTNNPLHWACYHGDIELIKVLIYRIHPLKLMNFKIYSFYSRKTHI